MKLKQLRTERNLTQQQVADALGIKQSKYSMIEGGLVPGDLALLYRIAEFFGVSIYDIWPKEHFINTQRQPGRGSASPPPSLTG